MKVIVFAITSLFRRTDCRCLPQNIKSMNQCMVSGVIEASYPYGTQEVYAQEALQGSTDSSRRYIAHIHCPPLHVQVVVA
jgi:hypothetical protein